MFQPSLAASASFGHGCGYAVQFDPARASLGANRPLSGCQADTAAPGFHLYRATDIAQVDIAAAGGNSQLAGALFYLNVTAASFENGTLQAGQDYHVAAAG